jgi:hypothetical protein
MIKICRIGHRTPNNGVITIASEVIADKIYYGASFCSPKEKQYNKKLGTQLALDDLEFTKIDERYIILQTEFTNANILKAILVNIYYSSDSYSYWNDARHIPAWIDKLLLEQLSYPLGLNRYPKGDAGPKDWINIKEIVVESEYAKEQLLKAIKYLHNLRELDTDFVAVNSLVHMYEHPDKIVVKS